MSTGIDTAAARRLEDVKVALGAVGLLGGLALVIGSIAAAKTPNNDLGRKGNPPPSDHLIFAAWAIAQAQDGGPETPLRPLVIRRLLAEGYLSRVDNETVELNQKGRELAKLWTQRQEGREDNPAKKGMRKLKAKPLTADDYFECFGCGKLGHFKDSWAPGNEALCDACDTEVTGRVHKRHAPKLPPAELKRAKALLKAFPNT